MTNGSGSGSRRPKNMWIGRSGSGFGSGSATLIPALASDLGEIKKRKIKCLKLFCVQKQIAI
jgi:hypothetical protein